MACADTLFTAHCVALA